MLYGWELKKQINRLVEDWRTRNEKQIDEELIEVDEIKKKAKRTIRTTWSKWKWKRYWNLREEKKRSGKRVFGRENEPSWFWFWL